MKNILITGTSSGIGAAVANYLHTKGYQVIGTSRKPATSNSDYQTIKLDVTEETSVKQCIQQATEILGTIDVLVNNAGIGISGPLEDTTIEESKWQFETNYFGVVRMTQAILPQMRARNKGMILNISSMLGLIGIPFQGHYAATKFALGGFTESLRYELASYDIEVTNINPGDFKTDFTKNRQFIKTISPDYKKTFDSVTKISEESEADGADPIMIAKLIHQLVKKERGLKIRYNIGKTDQMLFLRLKNLIGDNLFEKVARGIWKI